MQNVWKNVPRKDPLRKLALVVLSIVANSAGAERHFSKLGHIYQDKHRNLLHPERAHKTAIVRNSIRDSFPLKARAKREFIPTMPSSTSGQAAKPDNGSESDDDEEAEDEGDIRAAVARGLRPVPEDGEELPEGFDDASPATSDDAERRTRIRLHFGLEELIPLGDIFDFGTSEEEEEEEREESPWGGSLWMYKKLAEQAVEKEMETWDLDVSSPSVDTNVGSGDAPMEID
ncbi:hypothetical protein EV715DRAFT_215408 [Schizophyllum commune]